MMEQVIVLLALIALMCMMSFMIQFFVFIWIFFRGIAGTVIMDAEKKNADSLKKTQFESVRERSQAGQIVDEDATEGEA